MYKLSRCLSLCHSVIIDPETGEYSSTSPDELALVEGAAQCGFKFLSRSTDMIIEIQKGMTDSNEPQNIEKEFYILYAVLDFDSERKCMSVIVRSQKSGQIFVITKGADSTIEKRLKEEYFVDGSQEND